MLKKLNSLLSPKDDRPIVVVSGLPRSGTSLMMQMLVAGGFEPMTDHIRTADDDNPKGYYEFERAKKLQEGDFAWLDQAHGKVVKIITALLTNLPANHAYQVVMMRRALPEILASQKKMLQNRGENPDSITDEEMRILFMKHMQIVDHWIQTQPNIQRIDVNYNTLVQDPPPVIASLNRFFGGRLDTTSMAQMVDPGLYRKRVDPQS